MIALIIRVLFLCLRHLKGGERIMVDVYVALIINNRRTYAQVPAQLQSAVAAELTALGLDTDGKPAV